jgi:hypothetical protein
VAYAGGDYMPTKVTFVEYGEQAKVKIVSYGEDMNLNLTPPSKLGQAVTDTILVGKSENVVSNLA